MIEPEHPERGDADRHQHPKPSSRETAGIRQLKREVRELRRANELREPQVRPPVDERSFRSDRRPASAVRTYRARRRSALVLGVGVVVVILAVAMNSLAGSSDSFPLPSNETLSGLSMPQRIAAIAASQVGYSTDPSTSYCNKFSAHWNAGTADCPRGETSEEWCADFAAWVWQKAGVQLSYGYGPGEINGGAVSFYQWGLAHGDWHPATSGYRAATGDVAVYGLSPGASPSAAHVAIVTDDPPHQPGPDVINGDGDRTGFSVVETGTDQIRADAGHEQGSILAGYVSPP